MKLKSILEPVISLEIEVQWIISSHQSNVNRVWNKLYVKPVITRLLLLDERRLAKLKVFFKLEWSKGFCWVEIICAVYSRVRLPQCIASNMPSDTIGENTPDKKTTQNNVN